MGKVLVLPGFMGSQLDLVNPFAFHSNGVAFSYPAGANFWADRQLLALQGIDPMVLDGTVSGDTGTGGQALRVGGALPDYYSAGMQHLQISLAGSIWANPVMVPYDWRQSVMTTATILSAAIAKLYSADNPVILVGHSQGGLIARLAYAQLVVAGKANFVRRIICLGSPMKGSYEVVKMFNGVQISGFLFTLLAAFQAGNILSAFFGSPKAKAIGITQTWPSVYELLPTDPNDGSDQSTVVRTYYDKNSFTYGGGMQQALILNALQTTKPALADPNSIPKGLKCVCIQGFGYPTVQYNPRRAFAFNRSSADTTVIGDGDGVVAEGTGLIAGADNYQIACGHNSLFKAVCASGLLVKIVFEDFDPSPTAPIPPVKETGNPVIQEIIQPPPFASITPPVSRRGRPRH